jgi:hypothetical protein
MSTQFANGRPSFKLKSMNDRQRMEWKEDCERGSLVYTQRDWGNNLDDFCDHVFYVSPEFHIFYCISDSKIVQPGNSVWVKTTEGNWLQGLVISTSGEPLIGPTRLVRLSSIIQTGRLIFTFSSIQDEEGFYYEVRFGPRSNLRKHFSPRNGEIKPDIECVRQMLRQRGYL